MSMLQKIPKIFLVHGKSDLDGIYPHSLSMKTATASQRNLPAPGFSSEVLTYLLVLLIITN